MANRHLIKKLKLELEDTDIRLFRRKYLMREYGGKVRKCVGYSNASKDGSVGLVEIATLGHASVDDIIHTIIHELLHQAGYNEEAVDDGLDNVAYQSRTLREAVATRLLSTALHMKREV